MCLGGLVEAASTVIKGKPATFRAKSGAGNSYQWIFPGGVALTGSIVQYTFDEAGPKSITLKVTAANGETNEVTKNVMVQNLDRPTAAIEASVNGVTVVGNTIKAKVGDKISLDSRSVSNGRNVFEEAWSVNGREYDKSLLQGIFNQVGTYRVGLSVFDPDQPHIRDQDNIQVVLENEPPFVNSLRYAVNQNIPGQIILTADAADNDGQVVSYKFEVLEKGRLVLAQVVNQPIAYFDVGSFPGPHIYHFRVTAFDDRSGRHTFDSTESFAFEKESFNNAPKAKINVTPGNQGDLKTLFNFFAEATDEDRDALRYEWVLPDGRKSFAPQLQHRFQEPGDKEILLRVTDGIATIEERMTVSVIEVEAEVPKNRPPKIEVRGVMPKQVGDTNTIFRFYLKAEDPDADRLEYLWEMGDGGRMFIQNPAYRYERPGRYRASVTVSDGVQSVKASAEVLVNRAESLQRNVQMQSDGTTGDLPGVSIAGPGNKEALAERVKKLSSAAEKSKNEALERQRIARELAEKRKEERETERRVLLEALETEQEAKKKLALERKLSVVDEDLNRLNTLYATGESGIQQEAAILQEELKRLKAKVIKDQRDYLNQQLITLKEQLAAETDREKRFGIGLDIERVQKYLQSDDVLGEFATVYKEELIERKTDLELKISETEDEPTRNLYRSQIDTLELLLSDLEKLTSVQLDLSEIEKNLGENVSAGELNDFLKEQIEALRAEQSQLQEERDQSADPIRNDEIDTRLSEIAKLLEQLGFAVSKNSDENFGDFSIDDITVVSAKRRIGDLIEENLEVFSTSTDNEQRVGIQEEVKGLRAQLSVLNEVDQSGFSPDMAVIDLVDRIETKKKGLIEQFRAERDTTQIEVLREKIVKLDDTLKVLKTLPDSGITDLTTLENAQKALAESRLDLTRTYVETKDENIKAGLLDKINAIAVQYELLSRFYNPQERQKTFGELKINLDNQKSEIEATLKTNITNDQQVELEESLQKVKKEIIEVKRIEQTLREALQDQFQKDIALYKESLLKELKDIDDPEAKAELQAEIDKIEAGDFSSAEAFGQMHYLEGLLSDVVVNTETNLFLYGQLPDASLDQAVFFEWDMGDGTRLTGQNIGHRFRDPGFYRVQLTISDGTNQRTDALTVKVIPKTVEDQ